MRNQRTETVVNTEKRSTTEIADRTVVVGQNGQVEEVDIDTGVEVGFIIATTCSSLELDEDEELLDDEPVPTESEKPL